MEKKNEAAQLVHTDGTKAPWYSGWDLTEEERDVYRKRSIASKKAKTDAVENGVKSIHPIYSPRLIPEDLMPQLELSGLTSLSLFSGGGGLDLGFERAGFAHTASFEVLDKITEIVKRNRPNWQIHSGEQGDVRFVDWHQFANQIDVLHGGPPCQPFSMAGRQKGSEDLRDMIPEFVRAVKDVSPRSFVMENVPALATKKFASYLENNVFQEFTKLGYKYDFFELKAESFGVPQIRRRIFVVGFKNDEDYSNFERPQSTHSARHFQKANNFPLLTDEHVKPKTMGVREALGLPNIGYDALAPTVRSGLTGPRQTTSILSSVSALKKWEQLQIWPNGVARTKKKAQAFPAKNDHYRLSIDDVAIIQGFPLNWDFGKAVYLAIGQIGNSVAPPVAYHIARAVRNALID